MDGDKLLVTAAGGAVLVLFLLVVGSIASPDFAKSVNFTGSPHSQSGESTN